uniref:Uncharacterized protein n=2 Tax=Corethron hystrix TaxID=216773 RepID=A0A7S1FR49_9STRA|mmetsp:Transcript_22122/g.50584  ORF Transcript_22122/g.50584 Transcript_22122/m.50584 type:complete len:479 (+) Transcript_22122:757-2193(+)
MMDAHAAEMRSGLESTKASYVGRPVAEVSAGKKSFGKVTDVHLDDNGSIGFKIVFNDGEKRDVDEKTLHEFLALHAREMGDPDPKKCTALPEKIGSPDGYDSSAHARLIHFRRQQHASDDDDDGGTHDNDGDTNDDDGSTDSSEAEDPAPARDSPRTIRDFLARAPPLVPVEDRPLQEEIPSIHANSMWTALNTAEPENGFHALLDAIAVRGLVPSANLKKRLLRLILEGPEQEGIRFLEPNRSELAGRLFRVLSTRFPASRHLNGAGVGGVEIVWDHVVGCLQGPLEAHRSMAQPMRMALKLGQAAAALEVFSALFGDDVVGNGATAGDCRKSAFRGRPAQALFEAPGGLREALKWIYRYYAQNWATYADVVEQDDGSVLPKISHDAMRCLEAMGNLACLVAWLFCATQGMEMDSTDLALVVKETLSTELMSFSKEKRKELEFSCLLSLRAEYASPLQLTLGGMLGLSSDLRMVGIF